MREVRSHNRESTAWLADVPGTYDNKVGGAYLYTASKGMNPVAEWWEVLYHHSTKGSQTL